MPNEDIVFGTNWFKKHQSILLWLLNAPIIKYWFRWILRIHSYDCKIDTQINEITPNSFSFGDRYFRKGKRILRERTTDFRTHDKFAKRLYYAFKPFWYLIHFFDWAMLDRVETLTKLSFGFSTLTVFPGAGTVTTDGNVISTSQTTWANARSASTGDIATYSGDGGGNNGARIQARKLSAVVWFISRAFFLFDTSALTSGAVISAAVLSLSGDSAIFGSTKSDADSGNLDIITTTPASNTVLATSDYPNIGSTLQATSPTIASLSASDSVYNDITLNATGLSSISKTSITKFGARSSLDTSNVSPTANNYFAFYSSDNTGTSTDPKLVITYTADLSINLNDSVSITENANVTKINLLSVSDAITITESVSATQVKTLSIFDAITITESLTMLSFALINVNDTITITESLPLLIPVLYLTTFQAITITESFSTAIVHLASVFDLISVTESNTTSVPFLGNISVFEALTISENTQRQILSMISVFDAVSITESRTFLVSDAPRGIVYMRSKQQNYPIGLDDSTFGQMRSKQNEYPLGMDDQSVL